MTNVMTEDNISDSGPGTYERYFCNNDLLRLIFLPTESPGPLRAFLRVFRFRIKNRDRFVHDQGHDLCKTHSTSSNGYNIKLCFRVRRLILGGKH